MLFVTANPNQFLLTGSGGRLENRGSAVRAFVAPGTVWVLVPSTKQEATFEFTQETRDGIPLRFKGFVVYRVADPLAAARQFDFASGRTIEHINALLVHVCLGELRDAVSHMTMTECIEQRKTTLSGVVAAALGATIETDGGWGIAVDVAQVSQVYIVDGELRQRLEAGVRNEIKLASDRSDIETREATRLAEMTSESRLDEQRLVADRERLHRDEQRAEAETPVRLLQIAKEVEVLREEVELRELRQRARQLEVDEQLTLPRAEQAMRAQILPLEQAPEIVASASQVLRGTNLSIYGDDGQITRSLAPILELVGRAVAGSSAGPGGTSQPA